jgi:hypothetical protein
MPNPAWIPCGDCAHPKAVQPPEMAYFLAFFFAAFFLVAFFLVAFFFLFLAAITLCPC